MSSRFFVADVGNSTIDVGEFLVGSANASSAKTPNLPTPVRSAKFTSAEALIESWHDIRGTDWLLGSVNRPVAANLEELLIERSAKTVRLLTRQDFEIPTVIRNNETVGIDRWAAATAANALRHKDRPAIVFDAGTAITVDCVSTRGVFLGGMIAPGFELCIGALNSKTNQLPSIETPKVAPPLVGDETVSAIESGIFWMVAAGLDGILDRLQNELAGPCDVFATGGSSPAILPLLDRHRVHHYPQLVLSGLAMRFP